MKDLNRISQRLVLIGQLGLSLLMPLLICLGACYLLVTRLGLGMWIYLPGFIFGLGGSFMTAYKFGLSVIRKAEEEGEDGGAAFNSHS